jgi:hypothetical protein
MSYQTLLSLQLNDAWTPLHNLICFCSSLLLLQSMVARGSLWLPRHRSRLAQPTVELRPPSIDRHHRRFLPHRSLLAPRRSSTHPARRRFTTSTIGFRPVAASYARDGALLASRSSIHRRHRRFSPRRSLLRLRQRCCLRP